MKPARIVVCFVVLLTLGGLLVSCSRGEQVTSGESGEEKTAPQQAAESVGKGYVLQPGEGEVLRLGGPPGGQVIIKADPTKTGSMRMAMGIQVLEGKIPIHLHEQQDEFLFVHTGQGIGIVGDERVPVEAGTTIYIPLGVWHGVENTGDKPAQIMWVVTPAGLEDFFREAGAPPGTELKSLTPEQFADIMRKHGMKPKRE
ncbi:MAG: cupin domain-containing protein [Terriglobia bacterium]